MVNPLVWLYVLVLIKGLESLDEETRIKKQLSVFSVVNFPNTACDSSTTGRNGTCYTASECTVKGGTSSGACASSFGVCCVFEKSCGAGALSENNTYFTATDITKGAQCSLTICKLDNDVCQLRLDYETFALNNPVTLTTATGLLGADGSGLFNSLGQCQVDQFSVSSPGGKAPPVICGTNTGQHMYVPASDACNILSANIGSASTATTSAFAIKVTQVECGSKTKAPDGCLQYFTGTTGTIDTFNYNAGSGVLLTNQDYAACIRSERTICTTCYFATSAIAPATFGLSVFNGIAANGALGFDTNCGFEGHNAPATAGGGYDYIEIPNGQCDSPSPAAAIETTETNDRYCGTSFLCVKSFAAGALVAQDGTTKNTVCTSTRPFKISVHSDSVDYIAGAAGEGTTLLNNVGFSIGYFQKTACLTKPDA